MLIERTISRPTGRLKNRSGHDDDQCQGWTFHVLDSITINFTCATIMKYPPAFHVLMLLRGDLRAERKTFVLNTPRYVVCSMSTRISYGATCIYKLARNHCCWFSVCEWNNCTFHDPSHRIFIYTVVSWSGM